MLDIGLNMEDKELLEKAAKAIGLDGEAVDDVYLHRTDETPVTAFISGDGNWWNPLHDDGDALRLAVTLAIDIAPPRLPDDFAGATHYTRARGDEVFGRRGEGDAMNAFASTRYAIVLAAASMA